MDVVKRTPIAAVMGAAIFLCGCGGGGSAANRPPTASFTIHPNSGPPPLAVTLDASASRDGDGFIATYEWDVGTGDTVTGQTVQYTYVDSGAYEVQLTVTDDDGARASVTGELVANVLPTARITADPVAGEAPVTVNFSASQSTDEDGEVVSFDWDFAGSARANGATAAHTFTDHGVYPVELTVTDDLGGVAEVVFEVNVRDDAGVAYTVAYVPSGVYADALRPCAYSGTRAATNCTLERLPFLGAEFSAPTVDDVLTRLLVSHRWMGDSFREVLAELPADVRQLARSVTAIVIASDIRPAHYRVGTGAIYLDAGFFWRSAEERAVVTMEADFRSGFGRTIPLYVPWRYVRNNAALGSVGTTRAVQLLPIIAFLLYHELSHAADFVPASRIDDIDRGLTAYEAGVQQPTQWPSSRLATAHPLRSQVMRELAGVFFLGASATRAQEALQPDEVVEEFAFDGAVDFYSYSTQFEDLADLHDTLLMSYHHGYEKDVGVIGRNGETDSESIVAWGQRGRMTDPAVIDRARWVIDALYPGDTQALHGYLNARPAPLPMRGGDTWADNVVLQGGDGFSSGATLPGGAPIALSLGTGAGYNLVGCIHVPDGAPAALRKRLGLQ